MLALSLAVTLAVAEALAVTLALAETMPLALALTLLLLLMLVLALKFGMMLALILGTKLMLMLVLAMAFAEAGLGAMFLRRAGAQRAVQVQIPAGVDWLTCGVLLLTQLRRLCANSAHEVLLCLHPLIRRKGVLVDRELPVVVWLKNV
mmetsp:Transcript_33937/g.72344  ORF Transcript_33937/g.72344 Transcript_33937/m.72344 type:complete len:148 (-) Transcript_33937:479-922(-)